MTMRKLALSDNCCKRAQGFTLIELLIVVATIAVILAIAIPNYQDYMTKSRRSDAKTLLLDIAAREEQFFLDNRSYTGDLGSLLYQENDDGSVSTDNGYYHISVTSSTATSFTLTAVPQGAQASDTCGNLTLTEAGVTGQSGSGNCW